MVYCGKPSRACHACRQKKTRCDAKPEGCTPCARTGRQCPGYREQVDLMFRDQSSNVVRKAKAAEAKKSAKSRSPSSASSRESSPNAEPTEHLELVAQRWDPIYSIGPTLEEQATCYFVFHYLVGIQAPSRGVLDNLLLLYQTNSVDQILLTALKAVSFANYAHHTRSTELKDASTYQYTKAVTLTNAALRSKTNAAKDSTLMSVMILSMYELLTGSSQRSLEAWMEHIRGSAALVKLRGEEQLKTPQGRRLFIQASIGILTSCVQLNIPVPKTLESMINRVPTYLDVDDDLVHIGFAIHQTMIEVNQFRAAVDRGNVSNLHDILTQAIELDDKLHGILVDHPPEFNYYTLHAPESEIAYQGTYHVYFDLFAANIWNTVRVFRILLHEQVRDALLKGFATKPPTFNKPEHTSQLQRSMELCSELQREILYSVPQHFGYVSHTAIRYFSASYAPHAGSIISGQTLDSSESTTLRQKAECVPKKGDNDLHLKNNGVGYSQKDTNLASMHQLVQVPDIRASGGYNLMWPLWLAGSMNEATEEIRQYASGVMRRIGEEMGIQQALMLANVVQKNEIVVDAWENKEKFELVEEY